MEKYKIELTKNELETVMDALNHFTDSVRATLLKLNVSKEEYNKLMSELLANQLYRDIVDLWVQIEKGNIEPIIY